MCFLYHSFLLLVFVVVCFFWGSVVGFSSVWLLWVDGVESVWYSIVYKVIR